MPGIGSTSVEGYQSNVVLDTIPYDIIHRLTIDTLENSYNLKCTFRVPTKPDTSSSAPTVISNAQKKRQIVYLPETFTAEFPARMGTTAIIAGVNRWLDKVNTQNVAGASTPGIHPDSRDVFLAGVIKIVNPTVVSSPSDLKDPNVPITP